jgi:hypothetical protein
VGSFLFASVALALIAQDPDAGPACDPACNGATELAYCDDGEPATIDCTAIGGRCTLLSDAWGDDCVLSAGQACDPGYAFGASRCDRAASLFCIGGECTQASGPENEPDEEPTPGTEVPITAGSTNPFGCPDCGEGQSALLVPALFGLRALRRRRAP